jgi:sugar/nucleoside kinase (ribokinase family)
MKPEFEILTIGNAIVDVLAGVDDAFLAAEGMTKNIMHLIDGERAEYLYARMADTKQQISGGSAANSAAGVASLGGAAAYVGKVAKDELGSFYAKDLRQTGVHFDIAPLEFGTATARSMIFVTPDGERTMNTYLGAAHELTIADISEAQIGAAQITFMEGYLWDPPEAKRAFVRAAEIAHRYGRKTAITLSDPFCVNRYRSEFLGLLRDGTIDILLANAEELMALYEVSSLQAGLEKLRSDCALAAVTRGAKGALVLAEAEVTLVDAFAVNDVVDVTGAGDLFASGFLMGVARGRDMEFSARLGCLCASEVIAHFGARPLVSLAGLARDAGLEI